jgi:hypothetical protein
MNVEGETQRIVREIETWETESQKRQNLYKMLLLYVALKTVALLYDNLIKPTNISQTDNLVLRIGLECDMRSIKDGIIASYPDTDLEVLDQQITHDNLFPLGIKSFMVCIIGNLKLLEAEIPLLGHVSLVTMINHFICIAYVADDIAQFNECPVPSLDDLFGEQEEINMRQDEDNGMCKFYENEGNKNRLFLLLFLSYHQDFNFCFNQYFNQDFMEGLRQNIILPVSISDELISLYKLIMSGEFLTLEDIFDINQLVSLDDDQSSNIVSEIVNYLIKAFKNNYFSDELCEKLRLILEDRFALELAQINTTDLKL